jgi:hypothetical protein
MFRAADASKSIVRSHFFLPRLFASCCRTWSSIARHALHDVPGSLIVTPLKVLPANLVAGNLIGTDLTGTQSAPTPSAFDGSGSQPSASTKLDLLDAALASDLRAGSDYRRSEWLGADMQTTSDESSDAGLADDLLELLAGDLWHSHS